MKLQKTMCLILVLSLLIVSGVGVKAYTGHAPIRINSNNDFDASHGVSGGDGSADNPWIIENYNINGTGYGYCIYIGNTTDYFVIRDNHLHHAYLENYGGIYYPNAGIMFYNVENGMIMDNEIDSNRDLGIALYMSSQNTVEGNNVTDNAYGIYLFGGSDYNEASYNYASFNAQVGIASEDSEYNEISFNTADYNAIGIYLNEASNTLVTQNLAFYNDYGLYSQETSESIATNNSLCLSVEYGVYLDDASANNEIYHNNFGNNNVHACDEGTDNSWDGGYPSGGNFWTGYGGADEFSGPGQNEFGSDGIGDTPYGGMGSDSEDGYPLMDPVGTYGIGKRDEPSGIGKRDEPS